MQTSHLRTKQVNNSADIVALVLEMRDYYLREFGKYKPEVTMKTVKNFILKNYEGFEF